MEINKILIIDDEEPIVRLLKTILTVYGYECDASLSSEEGWSKIQEELPDLVVLDIAMPGMDGYEVCRLMKANEKTKHIPVLIITALSLIQDKMKAMDCGANGFIFKPFDPQNVIDEIRRLAL